METKPYLIVIPYLAEAAQGEELKYALAGWRRHFKEPYHIVLIGEKVPKLKGDDITCIESKRVPAIPGQYRQHLDYVNCLRKVRKRFPDSEGFIMVADDCYAINDFDIADVRFLKCLEQEFNCDPNTLNGWRRDKLKTKEALKKAGNPVRNYTTHLPQWYDWDKWEALVQLYGMDKESYVVEDLYYNTYYAGRVPFQISGTHENLKLGVYSSTPFEHELKAAPKTKIWVTNSPVGWCKPLIDLLEEHLNQNED